MVYAYNRVSQDGAAARGITMQELNRPSERLNAALKQNTITMWAGRGIITINPAAPC